MESINKTSLKVNPKVRLSDKNDWNLLIKEKYKPSKKWESRLRNPSQAVLLAGALFNPSGLSYPPKARIPSQISVIESQRENIPNSIVIRWVLLLNA